MRYSATITIRDENAQKRRDNLLQISLSYNKKALLFISSSDVLEITLLQLSLTCLTFSSILIIETVYIYISIISWPKIGKRKNQQLKLKAKI